MTLSAIILLLAAAPLTVEMTLHPKIGKLAFRAPGRVLMLRDGRFACASNGKFMLSSDEGKNWQPLAEIPPGPGPKAQSGMLVEDNNGALALIYSDSAGFKLERTLDNMPLPGARLQIWCTRSADGGKTWTNHQRLIEGYCGAFIGAICTRESRLVVPLQELRYSPPRHVTIVFVSDDGGKTWRNSKDLDIGGNGMEDGGFEATVAERRDGSLLMLLRTTRESLWMSESRDGGLTWTEPKPTNIKASNSPAFLLSLHSGRLALVWNPLHPDGKPDWPRRLKPRYAEKPDSVYREEMLLAFSNDAGRTWTPPTVIAKQPGGRLRYAYMFERRTGEIWLALRGQWLQINERDFITPVRSPSQTADATRVGATMLPTEMEPVQTPFTMPQPTRPLFPKRTVNIRDHGAVGDGKTLCTTAIARAIESCAKAGGGRVLVPAGTWLTGAIHLRSNIELHLEKDAVLLFSTDPKDYLPVVFTRWAGFECYNYSPLIYARDCKNIAVTGAGKLAGQGQPWWDWVKRQDEMAAILLDYGRRGVPVAQRIFGSPDKPLRPQFISPINCRNVLIEGVSLDAGPFWTIQCVYCENVIVRGVTVENAGPPRGPNNDGINLDSCRNALVEYCTLDTGDDCICLKSGLNEDGWRVGRPTENVVIRYCLTKRGHGGAVIGSDMSGNVRHVLVQDCVYDGTLYGVRLKSARGRGGVVEDVSVQRITMRNILGSAIFINTFYKAWAVTNEGKPPLFCNVRIQDVTCEGARAAVEITGLPEQPIENVTLQRLSISAKTGLSATDVHGLILSNVNIKAASGPPFQMTNCHDVAQDHK